MILTSPVLTRLNQNPTVATLVGSLLGVILPQELLAFRRSKQEFYENLPRGMTETLGYYGGGYWVNRSLNRLFDAAKPITKNQKFWRRLGESAAVFSVLAGFMAAVSPFKNWMSARFLHQTRFSQGIIQGRQRHVYQPSRPEIQHAEKKYRHRTLVLLASGLAGAATFAAGSLHAMKADRAIPALFQKAQPWLEKHVLLGRDRHGRSSFWKMQDFPSFLFYGAASFMSSIVNARDSIERLEWYEKFANFTACFFVLPHLIQRMGPKLARWLHPRPLSQTVLSNATFWTKLASQIMLMSASTLVIQKLTTRRLEDKKQAFMGLADDLASPNPDSAQSIAKKSSVQTSIFLPYNDPSTPWTLTKSFMLPPSPFVYSAPSRTGLQAMVSSSIL